jgi:glycosyltransferase involved in cell wall biosynthesis
VRESSPASSTIEASVLIPSYNDKQHLLLCIATPFRLQVIQQSNRGRAAALNRAAEAAEGRLLIVTDSDVLANPEFVRSHIEAHAQGDVVIGPIPLSDRSPQNFLTEGVRRWAERHERSMQGRTGSFTCSEIYGANLSISQEHFNALGGYRTDLRRTEDFQLGKRIIEAGHTIVFCPGARAVHIYDKTIAAWCHDFYQDGIFHLRFVQEFPDEIPNLKIGRYYPQSFVKRIVRPLVIGDSLPGRWIVACSKPVLELARRRGLTWRLLSAWKGVIGDALFWKGVHDELDDGDHFDALIGRQQDPN